MIASEQDSWNNCTVAHISLKLRKLTGWCIILCINVVQLVKHFWNYCLSSFYPFNYFPWEGRMPVLSSKYNIEQADFTGRELIWKLFSGVSVEMWGVSLIHWQPCRRGLPGKIAGRSKLFTVPCCSFYIYETWRSKEFGRVRRVWPLWIPWVWVTTTKFLTSF